MFGDNQSVITSSTLPESPLSKRHVALSFHQVREAMASGMLAFIHTPGILNPADILSKLCGYQQAWPHIKPLLFWRRNTLECDLIERTHKADKEKKSTKVDVKEDTTG